MTSRGAPGGAWTRYRGVILALVTTTVMAGFFSPPARADLWVDYGPVAFNVSWSGGAFRLARCRKSPGLVLARLRANCPVTGEFPGLSPASFESGMSRAWEILNPGVALDPSRIAGLGDAIRRRLDYRVTVQSTMHPHTRDLVRAILPVFRGGLPLRGRLPVAEGEAHFLTLLTYQNPGNDPVEAHTFASVATLRRDGHDTSLVYEFTVSWLPSSRNGAVNLFADPEAGRNYSLAETLGMSRLNNRLPLRWGPFPVSEALREQMWLRKQYLDRWGDFGRAQLPPGQVHSPVDVDGRTRYPGIFYKALDKGVRLGGHRSGFRAGTPAGALNCFHAISDAFADSPEDMLANFDARGYLATWQVLEYMVAKAGEGFLGFPAGPDWSAEFMIRYLPVAELAGVSQIPHGIGVPVCEKCRNY